MEKRVVLAVVLTVAVIFLTNVLFPPPPAPIGTESAESDSLVQDTRVETDAAEVPGVSEPSLRVDSAEAVRLPGVAQTMEGDTIVVRSDLYEFRFSTLGATLIGARLLEYESYSARANGDDRVELVRSGDRLFGYRVAAGGDTASLRDRLFTADRREIFDCPTNSPSLRFVS
jgi:YidC/Oxa1 family membrane protein insertase